MAHVHAEVEKPPLSAAGGHRTAVRRFPTEGRSIPEEPGGRAAAGELLRAALTLAAASTHAALQAEQLREAAAAPDREWPRPRGTPEFTAGAPTGRND